MATNEEILANLLRDKDIKAEDDYRRAHIEALAAIRNEVSRLADAAEKLAAVTTGTDARGRSFIRVLKWGGSTN